MNNSISIGILLNISADSLTFKKKSLSLKDIVFIVCFSLISILLLFPLSGIAQQKVMIIGIDGCRQDALQAAFTPNIDDLIAEATYSYDALNEPPTWSGVGWSGMLTGVWRNKHGVIDNSFSGSNFTTYPHFMKHVEDFDSSLYTASICHWSPINTQIVGSLPLNLISNPSSDSLVGVEAINILSTADPDVIFLHFDDVDHAGHLDGFSPAVPSYISAIETVDRHVGYVMTALKARANFANENWLIIGSTDHGGTGNSHGGSSLLERNIFFFSSIPGQAASQISKSLIISNSNCMQDSMGLRMTGNTDYASVPNNSLFQFGASQDFTIELRMKTSGWLGDPSFIGNKDWISGFNTGFIISAPGNAQSTWKVNIGDGSNRADITGSSIDDNLWHHLAASFDRNGLLQLYKDGLPDGNVSISSVGNIDNSLALGIGQDGTLNYGSGMNGIISEVRIWKTIVDSANLAAWQCIPLNNTHPDYSNLVGYWKINEGSGIALTDSSLNTLHATYNGSSLDWELVNTLDTSYDYSNTPRIIDVAVTSLSHLCIPIDPAWNLDGNAVGVPVLNPQAGGNINPCQMTLESYTVTTSGTQPLSWSVSNGNIIAGQDSTTVLVQWGTAGPGSVIINQCNTKDTLDIIVDICTGISELIVNPDFTIFPNPSDGIFKIISSTEKRINEIKIFNVLGIEIYSQFIGSAESYIDFTSQPKGMYIISGINNNKKITNQKVLIR